MTSNIQPPSDAQGPLLRSCKTIKNTIRTAWDLLRHRPSGFAILFFFALATWFISISGNLALDGVSRFIKGEALDLKVFLLSAVIFALCLISGSYAWILRETFNKFLEQTFIAQAKPCEVLIFFVSHQSRLSTPPAEEGPICIDGIDLPRTDLLKDAELIHEKLVRPFFSWEMILRGIYPHHWAGTLKRIYLVGSAQGERADDLGTQRILPVCKAFLQAYVPKIEIIEWKHSCDFEMMQDVQILLDGLIAEDGTIYGSRESDICIDITGGQKPSSCAAALVSVNRRITIQYVQTLLPKEAHRYNLSYRTAPDKLGGSS